MEETETEVDVVYTYVNGQDPDFEKSFDYWKNRAANLPAHSAVKNRSRDSGELKYSIRSLEKFAPWIRNIYILTSTPKPYWLNLNSKKHKIYLIKHEDIIPNKYLPLFNSFVIELYLAEIPNLAEQFIYFNDDCFLGNYAEKRDFFTPDGKCRLDFDKEIKNMKIDPQNVWQVAVSNSFELIKKKFGFQPDFLIHQAHPFLKTVCKKCIEYFREEVKIVSENKFRAFNDLVFNNVIYPFYILHENKGVESEGFKGNQELVDITNDLENNQRNLDCLLAKKPKLFCINDCANHGPLEIRAQIISFLERYFPEKSEFEI